MGPCGKAAAGHEESNHTSGCSYSAILLSESGRKRNKALAHFNLSLRPRRPAPRVRIVSRCCCCRMPRIQINTNPSSPPATAVGGTNVSLCPPRMPSTRLIAVFAVSCINLNVAAAIAIPTALVNFLWDELAHVRAGCSNRSSYERNSASSPVCVEYAYAYNCYSNTDAYLVTPILRDSCNLYLACCRRHVLRIASYLLRYRRNFRI